MTATQVRAPATADAVASIPALLAEDLDAGFAALFEAYRHVVYTAALRVCGRSADAEDLSAEAFLRAYRALRGYDRGRLAGLQPRAWLLAIVLNVWRNSRRSAARRPPPVSLDEGPGAGDMPPARELAAEALGAADLAESHETARELAALLLRLPEAQRVAIVLRHVSGLGIAEIAVVLGCAEGTVKSHISRGLRRLRTWCGAAGSEEVRRGGPRP